MSDPMRFATRKRNLPMSTTGSHQPKTGDILPDLTQLLRQGQSLSDEQATAAAAALADPAPAVESKEDFLKALAGKGEGPTEVAAFAKAFRSRAAETGLESFAPESIDVVGTGGDKSGTFNFSTATALLLASMGMPVMKHGNRSITSKSGSADLLAGLGVPMEANLPYLRESLKRFHFCFFFAPAFHPAFKEIMPVRKKLAETGTRTIFNLLGPLINPGRPAYQLMGVFAPQWVDPIASALHELGLQAALTVHSATNRTTGVDELTTAGDNMIAGSGRLKDHAFESAPEAFGLKRFDLSNLQGGEASRNLDILRELATGAAATPMEDTLCLNAGAAIFVTGRSSSITDGIETARESLRNGTLFSWITAFEDFNRKHA